ncbi:hypothetical protein QZM98_22710, partial [Burkholderia contaminans]|nr:hypothetical protein [Burkholderia contaminans]
LPGFMWRFSLVPCSGGWSWKPDSLGFHWRTAAFNLQLRLGHCQLAAYESVGQQRQTALSRGALRSLRELEVYPNLWAGVGLIRGGAGTAIVGSYDQVAARIHEYRALGIETFLLSSYPNLEEAARVGEDVLPRVRTRLARASLP